METENGLQVLQGGGGLYFGIARSDQTALFVERACPGAEQDGARRGDSGVGIGHSSEEAT